jgi:hypothetical protein
MKIPPDSLQYWWDELCKDLDVQQKGYTYKVVGAGLPDVVWKYFEDISSVSPGLSFDEVVSRALIIYVALTLGDIENQKLKLDILSAIQIVKEVLLQNK